MDGHRRAALAALLVAVVALAYAGVRGELRVGLLLVVPFVMGSGPFALVGFLALMAAIVLWMLGSARDLRPIADAPEAPGAEPTRARGRHGGVVLLGPIPIVWGSDRRVLAWMVGAGLVMLAVLVWLSLR